MVVVGTAGAENVGLRMSRSIMKQPTFDWSAKGQVWCAKELQTRGRNMLQSFNISQMERAAIIKTG